MSERFWSGSDVVSGALGALGIFSNASANSNNNYWNQQNYNLALRQQRFNEQSFDRQLRFNSPVTQAKLLRSTGLNPALMNSGLAGSISAGSSASVPSSIPYTPLDLNGLNGLSSNISLLSAQKRKIEEETKGQITDNMFKKENWLSTLYNRDADSWYKNSLTDISKLSLLYDKLSMSDRLKSLKLDNELKDAQNTAQTITLQYLTPRLASEINSLVSQQFVNYATGRASLTQAHAAIMNATTSNEEMQAKFGNNPELRKQYSNAVFQGLLQQRYESQSSEWKNINSVNPLPYNRYKRKEYSDWRGSNTRWD